MNTRFLYTPILIAALIGACTSAAGQINSLRGVVEDSLSSERLPGATLVVKDTYNGVSTNVDGTFEFRNLPEGEVILVVNYLGYKPKEISIRMPDEDGSFRKIQLPPMSTRLGAVNIVSSYDGTQRALNQQRSSDNIKNVVSADQIGKTPDVNVAEALQRIPGVNINRDKGEGSEVSIRGTPIHFTTVSINGEQIPSVQQSGVRTEALDLIPADQLGSMEVTKAITPDMDGDAIGGNINLRTPTARGTDLSIRAEAGAGYNDLSGGINGIGRLRVAKRFFANDELPQGRLGVMTGVSFFGTDNSEDRIDARWQGLPRPVQSIDGDTIVMQDYQFRKTENNRTRIGATATIDYKFNKNHDIIFNYMYNQREDNDVRNRLRFDLDRSASTWFALDSIGEGRVRRDINIWDELKTNHNFNLQGFHTMGLWKLEWGGFYTISERDFSSTRGDFAREGVGIVARNEGGIYNEVPQFDIYGNIPSLYDPLLLDDFRRYEEDEESARADNLVGKVNLTREYLLGDYKGFIKFGAKVRSQQNSKSRNNVVFAWNDPNQVLGLEESFVRVISDEEPNEYLNGRYRLAPLIDEESFTAYIDDNRRFLTVSDDAWDSRRLSLSDTYDAFEDIYSAYAMTRIQIEKLMVLAGFRYEYNDVRYDAFDVLREGTNVVASPIQGGNNYGFLLPNLQLKYNLNKMTNFRFAYTQSYARPNFVNLVPFINYDVDAITLRLGNPELQPSLSNNLDLMFEQYFSNAGLISVGAFYKHMDRFQFTRSEPSLAEDFPGFPGTAGFSFEQEQNGELAEVFGVEVSIMSQLNFLPDAFKGFNVVLNYTFTESDAFTQERNDISLPGQANHTWNAMLGYDYKGFSSRISVNYNGSFLNSVAGNKNDDIIQDERLQVDFNVNQRIAKRLTVYAEFVNITNAPAIRYQGIPERISRIAYFGWWTRFGLTYRL